MSETKLTAGALRAATRLDTEGFVFSWKTNQAAEIIDREMAGPKVEELVSLLLAWLDNQPDGRGEVELKILAKAREVEAALKGSAK